MRKLSAPYQRRSYRQGVSARRQHCLPSNHVTDNIASLILYVRDARLRYRNRDESNSKRLDLGIVLTSFSYSKQINTRDKVYASLGLVKPQLLFAEIAPDYNKSNEDVFYDASCNIIRLRRDLHLWSNRVLMSRRSMASLPSWEPEWVMKLCEETAEFATSEFSRCLRGNPIIHDQSLFVDGHLMDKVDATLSFSHDRGEFKLVKSLGTVTGTIWQRSFRSIRCRATE